MNNWKVKLAIGLLILSQLVRGAIPSLVLIVLAILFYIWGIWGFWHKENLERDFENLMSNDL